MCPNGHVQCTYMIRWTLRHLSLFFYCLIILYAAITAYKYVAKPFPKKNSYCLLILLLADYISFDLFLLIMHMILPVLVNCRHATPCNFKLINYCSDCTIYHHMS